MTREKKFHFQTKAVTLPNRQRTVVDMVEHPGAALIVPFLTEETVIILRQYRPVVGEYLWEFPAGTIDPGEDALACADRELQEETGYQAGQWRAKGSIYPVPGYATEVIYIYEARDLRPCDEVKGDPDEVIHAQRLGIQEVRDLWHKGDIRDAKTVCAMAMTGII